MGSYWSRFLGRHGLHAIYRNRTIWMVLCFGLLFSCVNKQESGLSQAEENNLRAYMAVRDYLLVNGRPPKDKADFVKFLEWKIEESSFYNGVLNIISDKRLVFADSDTLCEFTLNDKVFTMDYKKMDGVYCNSVVCDSIEYLRKQFATVKKSFLESKSDSLAEQDFYFKSPLRVNNTRDVIFVRDDNAFVMVQSQDTLLNGLYKNFGSRIPNVFFELGVDSLVLMMYAPYYSEFSPPPPPM